MDTSATGWNGLSEQSVESSVSTNKAEAASTVKSTPSQNFEWIQHGDASARKRARAHVTRGFRREKAALAKANASANGKRRDSDDSSEGGSPRKDSNASSSSIDTIAEVTTVSHINKSWERSDSYSSEDGSPPILDLSPTLGTGRTDPFGCMPIDLGPSTHALLDHFLSGVAPTTYKQDARANFQPVKTLSFEVALSAPPAFHVILSAAATDIATLHGRSDSRESIMHRGKALALVSKGLSKTGQMPGDDVLAAVALFTGNELLSGSPLDFNTHFEGLTSMVKVRGGLDSLQNSNPTLFGIINWFDYSGSCNLMATRRFVSPIRSTDILSSNPLNAPHSIISALPSGYDLREYIASLFKGLRNVSTVLWTSASDDTQRAESADFISRVDSDLYRSVCAPDQHGNRSRRHYVQQSYHILILLSVALISRDPRGVSCQIAAYLDILDISITTESERWGTCVIELLRRLIAGNVQDLEFDLMVKDVIDASVTLWWDEWRNIKNVLLIFFLDDEACMGRLQTLWKGRIAALSAQVS